MHCRGRHSAPSSVSLSVTGPVAGSPSESSQIRGAKVTHVVASHVVPAPLQVPYCVWQRLSIWVAQAPLLKQRAPPGGHGSCAQLVPAVQLPPCATQAFSTRSLHVPSLKQQAPALGHRLSAQVADAFHAPPCPWHWSMTKSLHVPLLKQQAFIIGSQVTVAHVEPEPCQAPDCTRQLPRLVVSAQAPAGRQHAPGRSISAAAPCWARMPISLLERARLRIRISSA